MEYVQLQNQIENLRRQLTAILQLSIEIESVADEGLTGFGDHWPSSLEHNLHVLEQMFCRYREARQLEEFIELLVAGRPSIAELVVAADLTIKKAAAGIRTASETLNHNDSPDSGFTSWHWFENSIRDLLTAESKILITATESFHRESISGNSQKPMVKRLKK